MRRLPIAVVCLVLAAGVTLLAANLADDFNTDPAANWSLRQGAEPTWDSGNGEFDATLSARWLSIYDTTTGSIEHENQVTFVNNGGTSDGMGSATCRGRAPGTISAYEVLVYNTSDIIQVVRLNAGGASSTQIGSNQPITMGSTDFFTIRLACRGTAGSAVTLDVWWADHDTTKPPTDPGWIGTDNSPLFTVTDSEASGTRLDNSADTYTGLGGHWPGSDVDTRYDYWKSRAISDRSGGSPPPANPSLLMMGVGDLWAQLIDEPVLAPMRELRGW